MSTCLDQNQNSVDCQDPNCTFGDCGATTQDFVSSPCLDQNENAVSCSDPTCTYGDCVPSQAGVIGLAAQHSASEGGTAISSAGNALTAVFSGLTNLTKQVGATINPPPPTIGTQVAASGLFSNPLFLIALLGVGYLIVRKAV